MLRPRIKLINSQEHQRQISSCCAASVRATPWRRPDRRARRHNLSVVLLLE
jgi:hypothetical protein